MASRDAPAGGEETVVRLLREALDTLGLERYVRTTGGVCLHVQSPSRAATRTSTRAG